MRVRDLIELLQQEDPERLVVLAKDPEGNGYSPMAALHDVRYFALSTWDGEIDHPDDDPPREGGVPALVFWPTN